MNLPTLITSITAIVASLISLLTVKDRWKRICAILLLALLALGYYGFAKNSELINLERVYGQAKTDAEAQRKIVDSLKSRLTVLGAKTDDDNGILKYVEDFKADWNTSDFYPVGKDTFCPKDRGNNNYQRMIYKYDTPLVASNLNLKFQMVDQNDGKKDYNQRIVVGEKLGKSIFSEFDIPTRNEQVVNFRTAPEGGNLVPGGEGKPIDSPIVDKTIVDLYFQTQFKYGQNIIQILSLNYLSKYGRGDKKINYDSTINDPRPETTRTNLFVGSYLGGCIKILNWSAN